MKQPYITTLLLRPSTRSSFYGGTPSRLTYKRSAGLLGGVDNLIAFAESEMGAKVFGGAEAAKGVAEHGKAIKAAGAKYCDCPACAAVEAILEKKDEMME